MSQCDCGRSGLVGKCWPGSGASCRLRVVCSTSKVSKERNTDRSTRHTVVAVIPGQQVGRGRLGGGDELNALCGGGEQTAVADVCEDDVVCRNNISLCDGAVRFELQMHEALDCGVAVPTETADIVRDDLQ